MRGEIALRPSYWASVSGGKDSLYMLNLILHNLDRYPLDGVVHFELDIDYPFIKNVIDYMESECTKHGIRFMRIKPRKSWDELYHTTFKSGTGQGHIQGFPTRKVRWCSFSYKADANKQLQAQMKELECYVVYYIGFCADEQKRFKTKKMSDGLEIYPLAENGVTESTILEWAKEQPIFNNFYKTNKRCGCMYCPMASRISMAYLLKYYPDNYNFMIERMRETEELRSKQYGRPFAIINSNPKYNADYLDNIIRTKWIKKLEDMENDRMY